MLESLSSQQSPWRSLHFPNPLGHFDSGTLIFDALMCPYRMGERVRALLLRSVAQGMLLMWDRGLHSYAMVQATLVQV